MKNGTTTSLLSLFQENKVQMTTHGVNMRVELLEHVEFVGDIFTPRFKSNIFHSGIKKLIKYQFASRTHRCLDGNRCERMSCNAVQLVSLFLINIYIPFQLSEIFIVNFFCPIQRTPLIFRQPSLSVMANVFILPLELDLWMSILILLVVVFIIMHVQLIHPILKQMSISSLDLITFILGAACQQGTHLEIPTTSGRFVVLTTFLATLALFTSYSASIVALLQSPSNFITNIEELIASPLKVGIQSSDYIDYAEFIESVNYSGVMELYMKKVQPEGEDGWIDDTYVGIEKVRTELFAFQVDSPAGYNAISKTFTETEKCGLSEIQMIVLPRTTFLVERNSGYKELISQKYNQLFPYLS